MFLCLVLFLSMKMRISMNRFRMLLSCIHLILGRRYPAKQLILSTICYRWRKFRVKSRESSLLGIKYTVFTPYYSPCIFTLWLILTFFFRWNRERDTLLRKLWCTAGYKTTKPGLIWGHWKLNWTPGGSLISLMTTDGNHMRGGNNRNHWKHNLNDRNLRKNKRHIKHNQNIFIFYRQRQMFNFTEKLAVTTTK